MKKDVNELYINGAKTIQLWHGNPMKKIGMDDRYSEFNNFAYKNFVKHIFSMAYKFNYDRVVSNAPVFTKKMASAFNVAPSNIFETGCPRNDIFFSKEEASISVEIRKKFKDCKLVYCLPTYRNTDKKQSLLDLENYNERALQDFLEQENIVFVAKAHFATRPLQDALSNNDRIHHLLDDDLLDINFLLKDANVLITDYSGAYFDFSLTQRPIIFAAFDLAEYISASRELYFEYIDTVSYFKSTAKRLFKKGNLDQIHGGSYSRSHQ